MSPFIHMNQDDMMRRATDAADTPFLFYPDYTVGPGVAPDLLTSGNSQELLERSRAIPPVGTCTPP
jgi:hypothetical protein